MLALPYDDELENAVYERSVDLARNARGMTLRAIVPNGGTRTLALRVPAGGAFSAFGIMGRALGPVDILGRRVQASTQFPMAGSSAAAGFPMADRGLVMRVRLMDGRALNNEKRHFSTLFNEQPVESILSAAYGTGWSYAPLPYRLFLNEGATLTFEITNRDRATGLVPLFHRMDLVVTGEHHVRG